jgi:hypothetical protein
VFLKVTLTTALDCPETTLPKFTEVGETVVWAADRAGNASERTVADSKTGKDFRALLRVLLVSHIARSSVERIASQDWRGECSPLRLVSDSLADVSALIFKSHSGGELGAGPKPALSPPSQRNLHVIQNK